ncbi:MAG: MBL fold metallo-hydrolase [Candidatus Bathyarchaeota archaeon]|nr:MBL fold metallo-hydrolase [Candidatus Bathyarchaeota archaeon]
MSIEWLGHAGFMIETHGNIIYLDPHEGEYNTLADLILITHSHSDHCNTGKIHSIQKDDTIIIAPQDCAAKIEAGVISLKPGEEETIRGIHIKAVEAYNIKRFRAPGMPFHPRGLGVGYILTVDGKTIYHAGDTDFIEEMKALNNKNITLALLPSGGTYTMDNSDAIEAALTINPEKVFPMHRWDTDPLELKNAVEAESEIQVLFMKSNQQILL